MAIKLLYIVYVIVELIFGSVRFGPISPRIVLAFVMLSVCFKNGYLKLDNYMKCFFAFVPFFILGGMVTGYTVETLKLLLSWHFAAFIVYQSTKMMICKYDATNIVIYMLLVIGIVDSVVTIGQFMGNPWAIALGSYSIEETDMSEYVFSRMDRRGSLVGMVSPGVLGPVTNGIFLSVFCVLSFFSKDRMPKIFNIVLLLLGLVASFVAQERTGTAIACVFSAYLLFKYFGQKGNIKLIAASFILFIIALPYIWPIIENILFDTNSRYGTIDNGIEVRDVIGDNVVSYLLYNPLGGFYGFMDISEHAPHNLLYNTLIYGGLFGGFIMLVLYIKQISLLVRNFFRLHVKEDNAAFLFTIAYSATILNGLTHNCSFVRGDSICWLLFAVVVAFSEKDKIFFIDSKI